MVRKRYLSIVGSVSAFALALSACGSGSDAPTDEKAPAEETVTAQTVETAVPTASETTPPGEPAMAETVKTAETPKPVAKPPKNVPIRGKGGLEEKCLARVGKETGARVIGTNRIEESQASIDIYVNIEGAQAPWRCRGYRDGNIESVEYSGSEGYL